MNGGSIISDDMTTATVNSPEAVEAVKFYTDMLTEHQVSPPSTLQNDGTANRRLFIAGTVAMYQSGQFDIGSIRKENANIDIGVMTIPHPEGKETAAIIGGWSFIIPKDAKNPEETKKFVQFLAESDNMGFFTDTFPAREIGDGAGAVQGSDPRQLQGDAALRPPRAGRTRTGSRSRRPISTASSASWSATRARRRRWIRRPRRSRRCSISSGALNEMSSSGARSATRGPRLPRMDRWVLGSPLRYARE